jgi:hypothetical protein
MRRECVGERRASFWLGTANPVVLGRFLRKGKGKINVGGFGSGQLTPTGRERTHRCDINSIVTWLTPTRKEETPFSGSERLGAG